jgi:hypothetical protein
MAMDVLKVELTKYGVQVACVNLSFVQSREFVLETNDSQVLKI